MNWQIWDTLFIVAGLLCFGIGGALWTTSSLATKIVAGAAGLVLVIYGLVTGLQMEAIYPLVLLLAPIAVLVMGLLDRSRTSAGRPAGAALAGGAMAPAVSSAPWAGDTPAAAPHAPAATPHAPAATAHASSATPYAPAAAAAPTLSGGHWSRSEADLSGGAPTSAAGSEPKASHEDIDAALAEWYFEPYEGEDAARDASAGAPAASAGAPAARLAEPARAAASEPAAPSAASRDPRAEASASHGFTAAEAADPATPAATLHRIAAEAPELHAQLATNPALYPDLRDWLAGSPDPEVQRALAERVER